MSEKMGNLNRETVTIKDNQMEILEQKIKFLKLKIHQMSSSSDRDYERILKITKSEKERKKF